MSIKLIDNYFQKSSVFLYPLLQYKKGIENAPLKTYIRYNTIICIADRKLICEHNCLKNGFDAFLVKAQNHSLYKEHFRHGNNIYIVYSLLSYSKDFDNFVKGYYSKLSYESRFKILTFHKKSKFIIDNIKAYLDPNKYYKEYSQALKISINELKKNGELCDKPNLLKETLIIKN